MARSRHRAPVSVSRKLTLVALAAGALSVGATAAVGAAASGPSSAAAHLARPSAGLARLLALPERAARPQRPAVPKRNHSVKLASPDAAVVAVSVAEVWGSRHTRPVDRPALQRPARVGAWLRHMSLHQRLGLDSRLDTQVRYGEPVVIVHRIGAWTRVRVPDQTGGHYPHGIIGWIASRQLAREPAGWDSATSVATVTATRTTLHSTVGGRQRSLGLSYATTLPVISTGTNAVEVGVPGPAQSGWLPRSAVRVHAPDSPALTPSAHQVIAQARRFLGLPYLWAGMSAWGFDCSGLTDTVFSMMGITLPRDAADQSRVGRWVPRRQLRPGDLVFFSSSRSRWAIHHVAIYAGHGRVLQSPYTGARVQLTKLWRGYLKREYWGATRPLS